MASKSADQLSPSSLAELASLRGAGRAALDERLRALGVTKLGQRLRILSNLLAEDGRPTCLPLALPTAPPGGLSGGASTAAGVAAASASAPSASAPSPRCAFVCHTGYFASGSFGGATRASLALLREARRICGDGAGSGGVDVIAIPQKPVPEALVFKLEDGQLGELEWEGERVIVGRPEVLSKTLRSRNYDVVVALSIEHAILSFAFELHALVHYATPHNYYLPPFGPFRRFPVAEGHERLLTRLDALLSPCEHHCEYLRRWGPTGLLARPLFAADYHYFHQSVASGPPRLAAAMRPWEASHRYVTLVSPAPEKGLAVFVTLARRLPDVAFAAVTTQWTGAKTLECLRALPNVSVLAAHPEVDVIFRQTRILLAPSLWQECCPLVVMEACLRGIPCISSDVFGLVEANSNPRLVVHASLSYDHARGTLHHGVSNTQLEARLGPSPALPSDAERAANVDAATAQEATADEVAPFEAKLLELLDDESALRREAAECRRAFLAFAEEHEGGLQRELTSVAARRGADAGADADAAWESGADAARRQGRTVQPLALSELKQARRGAGAEEPAAEGAPGTARSEAAAAADAIELLPEVAAFRVVHSPYVFLRAAPAVDAQVYSIVMGGTALRVDAIRKGWVRTATCLQPLPGGEPRQAWALVDGATLGLGTLLERCT